MKLPTLNDIAREAGLSNCVVSHVLNDDAYAAKVRPETRRRILEISNKIGYRRNQLASAIRTGQVKTIAVILNLMKYRTAAPFNQVMAGIMLEASNLRQSVKIFSENELEPSFRQIVENRIDKVIMISVDPDLREQAAELAENFSIHLVYAYERGHRNFPAVNVDNVEITTEMVRYLAAKGHTRIGLLCVPHRYHYVEDRHAGYLRGMEACGLKVDPRWISCSDDIESSVEKMLSLPPRQRPTVFVALSDNIAARVQAYAVRNGLRFPDDISAIGIGDTEIACRMPFPLTTMRESLQETGNMLVRLVMKKKLPIHPDENNVYHTHAALIERESVCFSRSANRMKQA